MKSGKLVVIDGLDGSGKGSNIGVLTEYIQSELGRKVVNVREPGGTPMAEELRNIVKFGYRGELATEETELMLMFSARSQLVNNVIKPELDLGNIVLSDRFTSSSYAYQGYGRGISLDKISMLEEITLGDLRPSLTIILDLDPEISLARAKGRDDLDEIEKSGLEFFKRSREGYLELARNNPDSYVVIDASKPLTVVNDEVIKAFKKWNENGKI